MVMAFLDFLAYLGVSQIETNWFWESWTCPQNPKSMKMKVSGFSQSGIEKLLVPNEAEYFYGAFGPLFYYNLNINGFPEAPRSQIWIFTRFPIGNMLFSL